MAVKTMYDDILFEYRNSPVTVVVLEKIEEFTVQGVTYGPFEKDREIDIPRWIAGVLASQKKVRVKDTDIGPSDLQKALWRETSEPDLQQLSPSYFFIMKQRIAQLLRENQQSPNQVRIAAQNKMERLLRDLVTSRLLKLMKISLREDRLDEIKNNMTEEECWLVDRLTNLLRNWERVVLEVENGG
ncbi:MAG: hypothetical protein ACFFCO_01705 [Promethearchaeota archaeon]